MESAVTTEVIRVVCICKTTDNRHTETMSLQKEEAGEAMKMMISLKSYLKRIY